MQSAWRAPKREFNECRELKREFEAASALKKCPRSNWKRRHIVKEGDLVVVVRWESPRHGAVPGASCSVSIKQRQISVRTGQELIDVHRQKMGQQQDFRSGQQ